MARRKRGGGKGRSLPLQAVIGSDARLRILLFLSQRKSSYQRELEVELKLPLFAVQTQTKRLQKESVIKRWTDGYRVYYALDSDYPLYKELASLLRKACAFMGRPEPFRPA